MVIQTCLLLLVNYTNIGKEDRSLAKGNANSLLIITKEEAIWDVGWGLWESKSACPKDYHEEEIFSNPWYFDEENRLASCVGKFAEPSVWYQFLKEDFFEPRGYQLCGDPMFIGEEELNFWEIGEKRYLEWKMCEKRMNELKKAYEQSV